MARAATEEAKADGPVSEELTAEIDKAVEQEMPEKDEEKETEEKAPVEETSKEGEEDTADQDDKESEESDDEPQGEESPDEPEGEEDTSEAEEQADELLTRAVRSGMSLKDAKIIADQDEEALARQIQLLEKTSQVSDGVTETEDDPIAGIPDLDPEVYDDNLVAGFKALKSVIKEQGETIKQLSSGNEKSWFNKQVESLKVKNIDSAKQTELNEQFDVLKAGYAAKGQEIDDTDVFQQATKLVLGDDIKATENAEKSKKLRKRAELQTARPVSPAVKPKGDPLEEIAYEVDKEFFEKK